MHSAVRTPVSIPARGAAEKLLSCQKVPLAAPLALLWRFRSREIRNGRLRALAAREMARAELALLLRDGSRQYVAKVVLRACANRRETEARVTDECGHSAYPLSAQPIMTGSGAIRIGVRMVAQII